ncbi:MAG: DUF1638 domain-containing protein [Clostridia bacterium]|nr:DUF1638 domain-containing protein [Clostridia bacterium]
MRLKIIACKAIFREISYLAAASENTVDVTWMRQGYHSAPDDLRKLLQTEIDAVEEGRDVHSFDIGESEEDPSRDFDAILLGYGLCSKAVTGICAKRHRLVIPRAHDCITFFLGSKERYASCFHGIPGCFWYTAGWIDNLAVPGRESQERAAGKYAKLGYDEETVEYLLEETGGLKNYHNAAYISMPFLNNAHYARTAKEAADYFQWNYHEIPGDTGLLAKFVAGQWDEEDFLILEPGEKAEQSYDDRIIRKARGESGIRNGESVSPEEKERGKGF